MHEYEAYRVDLFKPLVYLQVHTNEYTDFNEFERDRRRVHS